jgi:mannose-6-phosphate isomerase class I
MPDRPAALAATLRAAPRPVALECAMQHYGWGDPAFIPALLGQPNPAGEPCAELWIGAHHDLPSVARDGEQRAPLDLLIEAAPDLLGRRPRARFGDTLPFLLKVLSARQPLSIQVHPDQAQARTGFEREQRAGIPQGAPSRSYRDRNHKPELLVALTDFFALRGFRPLDEIHAILAATPELAGLAAGAPADAEALAALYQRLMRLPQPRVDALLDPLLSRLRAEQPPGGFAEDDYRCWLLHADALYSVGGHRDRGLFGMLLLNLIHLRPGQGIFLPAGELHSYLRGSGLELMANSNNVLRGGLTPKHIDVEALLDVVRVDPAPAAIIEPVRRDDGRWYYPTPAPEFVLQAVGIDRGECRPLSTAGNDEGLMLGLVLEGAARIETPDGAGLTAGRGRAFMLPAATETRARALTDTTLYLASVPDRDRAVRTARP